MKPRYRVRARRAPELTVVPYTPPPTEKVRTSVKMVADRLRERVENEEVVAVAYVALFADGAITTNYCTGRHPLATTQAMMGGVQHLLNSVSKDMGS